MPNTLQQSTKSPLEAAVAPPPGTPDYTNRLRQNMPPFVIDKQMYSPIVTFIPPPVGPVERRPGPGRPRIHPLLPAPAAVVTQPASNGEAPVKRGRGRPRIYPLGPDGKPMRPKYVYPKRPRQLEPVVPREAPRNVARNGILVPAESGEKRGPGRPRKQPEQLTEELPQPPKRGRGRPPGSGRKQITAEVQPEKRGRGRPPLVAKPLPPTQPPSLEAPADRPTAPFAIRVERLSDAADRKAIVDLFAEWFPKINRSIFHEDVRPPTLPQKHRSGRRTTFTGPFHWFIRDVETGAVLCAASGWIHSFQFCPLFMEISYFATRPSHLYLGLGRLLNAVLQRHAFQLGCEYILVQASHDAQFFWKKPVMGYTDMPKGLMAKFKHFYEMRSVKLKDTTPLAWEVSDPAQALLAAIERLPPLVRLEHA